MSLKHDLIKFGSKHPPDLQDNIRPVLDHLDQSKQASRMPRPVDDLVEFADQQGFGMAVAEKVEDDMKQRFPEFDFNWRVRAGDQVLYYDEGSGNWYDLSRGHPQLEKKPKDMLEYMSEKPGNQSQTFM